MLIITIEHVKIVMDADCLINCEDAALNLFREGEFDAAASDDARFIRRLMSESFIGDAQGDKNVQGQLQTDD